MTQVIRRRFLCSALRQRLERPEFRVIGALPRRESCEHAERFKLHDVRVQIQLHVAAVVGALRDRMDLAADRQPLAEIFRRDLPLRRVDAELQARAARQMARADLLRPELQPLIRERRLAPERQDAAGRIFPCRSAGERDPGRPAAAERADAPGGRLYGLRIAVRQDMPRPPGRAPIRAPSCSSPAPGCGCRPPPCCRASRTLPRSSARSCTSSRCSSSWRISPPSSPAACCSSPSTSSTAASSI